MTKPVTVVTNLKVFGFFFYGAVAACGRGPSKSNYATMRVACLTKATSGTTCPYCCSSEWQKRGATQDRLRFVLDCWRPWWSGACCYHFIMYFRGLVFFLLFDAFSAGSNCVPIYIRKVRSRNFPSGGDFPGIIWSVSIAVGIVLLVSTLSRGFQVCEMSTPQVVDG